MRILLIVSLILLAAGCAAPPKDQVMNDNNEVVVHQVTKFTYQNHWYLKFQYPYHCADTGTVHDPDCPCFKSKERQ